jgi:hypothetical protein
MKTGLVVVIWVIGLAATAGGPADSTRALAPGSGQKEEPPVVCGLRNAAYTGLCEERTPYVTDKELAEICKPILDCLNNTQCIRAYCGNTTIRRGWTLESSKRAK